MKNFPRIALFVAGGLVGALAVALLAVNLYVQSQGTQARIQRELSQRLGATLHIRRMSVTPWSGLKLTGITMPQSEAGVAGDFLKADTFRLQVRFTSLFSRRLVITEVSLVNPDVVWAQNKEGQWRLPSFVEPPEPEPAAPAIAAAPTAALPPPTIPPPQPTPAAVAAAPNEPAPKSATITPEVRRVNLTNGNFRFLDAKGKPVATFEGLRFRSDLRSATELQGNASIAKISLRDRFFMTNLKSPLSYDPAELDFSQITARADGGEISGHFSMRPADEDSPFKATVAFRDIQADRLVTEAGGPAGMIRGRLEGRLEAQGETADPNALDGTGEIVLRDGEVRKYSLLVALGQLLQVDDFKELRLEQAQVKYRITPGVVLVDELLLASSNIRLSATGRITFDGKLKLEARLAIDEKIRNRLFEMMREKFQPVEPTGFYGVDFQIGGTVERPKPNLMAKLVGQELNDLGGVLDSLLRGSRPRKQKKSPNESPTPSSTPVEPPPLTSPAVPAPSPSASP